MRNIFSRSTGKGHARFSVDVTEKELVNLAYIRAKRHFKRRAFIVIFGIGMALFIPFAIFLSLADPIDDWIFFVSLLACFAILIASIEMFIERPTRKLRNSIIQEMLGEKESDISRLETVRIGGVE